MEQEKLIKKISKILNGLSIPYIITGGIAVTIWGRPRFTADIDIVVELKPEKVARLAKELLSINKESYADEEMMRIALERRGEFNFIHPKSGLKVDFWIMGEDKFDQQRLGRRIKIKFGKSYLYVISPEDLILSKLLWYKESQSTRHLEDIESVIHIQKKLDLKYLKRWAKDQNTNKILEATLAKLK